MKATVKELMSMEVIGREVEISGWVRTFRSNRFIALSDGTTLKTIQCVVDFNEFDDSLLRRIHTGTALTLTGKLVPSQGKGQDREIQVDKLFIDGDADPDEYPLQPKKHSLDFLREKAHLRFRTNTFGAVFRLRHTLAFAVHNYFNERGFFHMHTPIITASDAEGAGEMFHVTSFDLADVPKKDGKVDYDEDFFERPAHLTVSGQLQAELAAMGMRRVYTFGPTFRAENSNTSRHLAEFWMIEPEVAFTDLNDNMDLAEDFLKYLVKYALDHAYEDLEFLAAREAEEQKSKPKEQRYSMGLIDRLKFVVENDFVRLSYTEAIDILRKSKPFQKNKFKFPVEWGKDLQSEHERYLVEKEFHKPVILTDYPASFKAFYMRLNDDGKTVAAMDVLFPGVGEITGGSQREERYDVLLRRCKEMGVDHENLWWYLETRKFGTCKHSGFGLGFERLVMFVSGMTNIRDVIPFPRTPGNCAF